MWLITLVNYDADRRRITMVEAKSMQDARIIAINEEGASKEGYIVDYDACFAL